MERLTLTLKESYNELVQHVSWPTTTELVESSVVVLIASILISLLTFGMDVIWSTALSFIYGIGG